MEFSVLLSIYRKEKPEFLRQCLDSIFAQTMTASEIILVKDGPLTAELDAVIDEYQQAHQELKTVKLDTNMGLGHALNFGLLHCSNDIVARMDTDDICLPERFEREAGYLMRHPEVSVVGSWVDEFSENPSCITSTRKVPEEHNDILGYSRKRNPMNHPSVMFRKQAVLNAGNYLHCPLFEDYYLWIRMFANGARFHNLQQSLLLFRMSPQTFIRRGGSHYMRHEANFQWKMFRLGHTGFFRMMTNIAIRMSVRLLPNHLRKQAYLRLLRS